jgi:hypothetical protein
VISQLREVERREGGRRARDEGREEIEKRRESETRTAKWIETPERRAERRGTEKKKSSNNRKEREDIEVLRTEQEYLLTSLFLSPSVLHCSSRRRS